MNSDEEKICLLYRKVKSSLDQGRSWVSKAGGGGVNPMISKFQKQGGRNVLFHIDRAAIHH